MREERSYFYEFEHFRLDPVKRVLWRGTQPVALTSRAFDTLVILVQSSGETVEKEVLIEKVWGGAAVEENNLTQCISALRKALGEGRSDHRFIVTFPGRGYRFVADVEKRQANPVPTSHPPKPATTSLKTDGEYTAAPASTPPATGNRIASRLPRAVWLAAIGALAAFLVGVLWGLGRAKPHAKPPLTGASAPQRKRTMLVSNCVS